MNLITFICLIKAQQFCPYNCENNYQNFDPNTEEKSKFSIASEIVSHFAYEHSIKNSKTYPKSNYYVRPYQYPDNYKYNQKNYRNNQKNSIKINQKSEYHPVYKQTNIFLVPKMIHSQSESSNCQSCNSCSYNCDDNEDDDDDNYYYPYYYEYPYYYCSSCDSDDDNYYPQNTYYYDDDYYPQSNDYCSHDDDYYPSYSYDYSYGGGM